jgi:hypothetical protein
MSVSPYIACKETVVQRESCKGVWKFKPTNLNSWGSFGLLNPAAVAWELLPFSFVVDWFLPVGRYLEGLDVPMRFDHLGGTIGYRRQVLTERENFIVNQTLRIPGEGSMSTQWVYVERNQLGGAPTVDLSSIVWEPKLGAGRVTSAISLLRQTFGR